MTCANLLYLGEPRPLPRPVSLKAGPLSLIYEAGDLRTICLGEVELLRHVYAAVRDPNWNTILPVLTDEQITVSEDSFEIRYDCAHRQNQIDFTWQAHITGEADGSITFRMQGQARSTFRRNRIGFCVLHPMSCAGAPVRIEHVDGSWEDGVFPTRIAPQIVKDGHPWPVAPFEQMRALSHRVLPELWSEVRFEGDVFEMEDQRNWTDASFKTYCTPLALPFPAEVRSGTEIRQSIRLSLSGRLPHTLVTDNDQAISLSLGAEGRRPMPALGLGTASHGQPLTPPEVERLKALRLSHLRLDLPLSGPQVKPRLLQAAAEARVVGASLEVALFLTEAAQAELAALRRLLEETCPPVQRWLVFHAQEKTTPPGLIELARAGLISYHPAAQFGAGTNAYFTEINANRPPVEAADFIVYSMNPQVHAFDYASLTETLSCQAETVASALALAPGKPVHVGPVTLKPRFNPNATGPEVEPTAGKLPVQVDPRQSSLYGLAWTLGSLKYLAEIGVAGLTYYETTGRRGVMELEDGAPLSDQFLSFPGGVYPLYHLFADAAEFKNGRILPLRSSRPLRVEGLLLENEHGRALLLANFTAAVQPVQVGELLTSLQATLPRQQILRLRRLNENNAEQAMCSPENYRRYAPAQWDVQDNEGALELLPFETARIDIIPR